MADFGGSDSSYMLDTFTQLASVKEHVEQVNKSNESVSWVLIGTPLLRGEDDVCRVLIMQVIQNGNVWGNLLRLLVEDRVFYCYVKLECSNIRGIFKRFLIHWIGFKVSKDNIEARKSHFDQINSVVGVSENIIQSRDHTALNIEITSKLTSFEKISNQLHTPKTSPTHSVNKQPRIGIKTCQESMKDRSNSKLCPRSMQQFHTVQFKMCVIGELGVGKSSILKSFEQGRGLDHHERPFATVGYDCVFHNFDIPNTNTTCRVTIWDTGGAERFRSMAVMSFRNSHVVVMVYDISDFQSFNAIPSWYADTKEYVDDMAIYMLVGNKLDLHERREVPQRTAQNYAKENGFEYFECSTTQGSNIFHLFNQIEKSIQHVYSDKLVHRDTRMGSIRIKLDYRSSRKSGCCLTSRRRSSSKD